MDPIPLMRIEDLWVFAYGSLMWRPGVSVSRAPSGSAPRGPSGTVCLFFVHRGTAGAGPGSCWGSIAAGLPWSCLSGERTGNGRLP